MEIGKYVCFSKTRMTRSIYGGYLTDLVHLRFSRRYDFQKRCFIHTYCSFITKLVCSYKFTSVTWCCLLSSNRMERSVGLLFTDHLLDFQRSLDHISYYALREHIANIAKILPHIITMQIVQVATLSLKWLFKRSPWSDVTEYQHMLKGMIIYMYC